MADSVLSKDILDYWEPPIQPLTDDEVETISVFAGIAPEKVRSIAWLTTMKLKDAAQRDGLDGAGKLGS